ncbi:MAG: hypothetical protein ROW48_00870 [Bellilinea sp.]|jgi:hypothetical protein
MTASTKSRPGLLSQPALPDLAAVRLWLAGCVLLSGWVLFGWLPSAGAPARLIAASGSLALCLAALILLLTSATGWLRARLVDLLRVLASLRSWNIGLYLLFWLLFGWLVFMQGRDGLASLAPRLWLVWLAAGMSAVLLRAAKPGAPFFTHFAMGLLVGGLQATTLAYFAKVSSYPFTLGWSEASRHYYASLVFSESIYGTSIPLSPLHPSRYFLLSLPFLLPDSPLWLHRAWQAFLWIALSLVTGWALARRLGVRGAAPIISLTLWGFLFLMQGPVYYHLHLCVIPVLLGYNPRRPAQTLLIVLLASVWAGLSRVNWFPMPAILAATIYLLETPLHHAKNWRVYFARPLTWGISGLAVAFLAQAAYIPLSGHEDASLFASSFTSPLLWHRLLPSASSGWGVLPIILIVSLPLLVFVAWNTFKPGAGWHPLRLAALAGLGGILFAGGLVVSTKIGGGSNIHNMDAYLVMLLLVAAYLWFEKAAPDAPERAPVARPWLLNAVTLIVPVIWTLNFLNLPAPRDLQRAEATLQELNRIVQRGAQSGEVLFISQRHLITFGYIQGVPLSQDYELLVLSEASISKNRPLLDKFRADLSRHRFAMIISNRMIPSVQRPKLDVFAEENNLWTDWIVYPVLEYYGEDYFFDRENIQVLVPK